MTHHNSIAQVGRGSDNMNKITMAQLFGLIGTEVDVHSNPESTYFRSQRVTFAPFAIQELTYEISNARFGSSFHKAVDKDIDLVLDVAVRIFRPAIAAEPLETRGDRRSRGTSSAYPVVSSCAPCADADREFFGTYGETTLKENIDAHMRSLGAAPEGRATLPVEEASVSTDDRLPEMFVHYANSFATAAVKSVTVKSANQELDTLHRVNIFIWSELCITMSQRAGYDENVGRAYSRRDLIEQSSRDTWLYQELPFWFCKADKALAPCCGYFSTLSFTVELESLHRLVVRSGPDVEVVHAATSAPLNTDHFKVFLDMTAVMLEEEERQRFVEVPYDSVIRLHGHVTKNLVAGNNEHPEVTVETEHAVTAINWVVQRECNVDENDFFAFGSNVGADPILAAYIKFGSNVREAQREATQWRRRQNRKYPSQPREAVYSYVLALDPCSSQPSGAAGMSRFMNFTIAMTLAPGLERERLTVHVCYEYENIIKHRNNTVGLAWT